MFFRLRWGFHKSAVTSVLRLGYARVVAASVRWSYLWSRVGVRVRSAELASYATISVSIHNKGR